MRIEDFESYFIGPIAGQNGWIEDANDVASVIFEDAYTIATGHGKVLKIDPETLDTGHYSGVYWPFPAAATGTVVIEFDQYRGTLKQSVVTLETTGAYYDSSFATYQYGLETTPSLHPTYDVSDSSVVLTSGIWQHVKLTVDFDALTVAFLLDGVAPAVDPQTFALAGNPAALRGFGIRVWSTNLGAPNGPNYFDNLSITGMPELDKYILYDNIKVTGTNQAVTPVSLVTPPTFVMGYDPQRHQVVLAVDSGSTV